MLRKFQIRNYRSIDNATVYLEPLSVFVGPNGSGKTNFFRGLELFGELLASGTTDPALEEPWEAICYRGTRSTRTTIQFGASVKTQYRFPDAEEPSPVWIDISVGLKHVSPDDDVVLTSEALTLRRRSSRGSTTFGISFKPNGQADVVPGNDPGLWDLVTSGLYLERRKKEEWTADRIKKVLQGSSERLPGRRGEAEAGHFLHINQIFSLTPWFTRTVVPQMRVRRYRLETASLRGQAAGIQMPPRGQLGLSGQGLPEVIDRLKRDGSLRPVIRAMQAVMPSLVDVDAVRSSYGRRTLVFRESASERPIPEAAISDGTLHTLALLALLAPERRYVPTRGRILVLEEVENAIHPWAIATLLNAARRAVGNASQVLLSTHSPVVVDATPPSSLFVVEREQGSTGITPARQIRADLTRRLAQSGMTLGEVWVDGILGGTPVAEAHDEG